MAPLFNIVPYAYIETTREFNLTLNFSDSFIVVVTVCSKLFDLNDSCVVKISGIRTQGLIIPVDFGNFNNPALGNPSKERFYPSGQLTRFLNYSSGMQVTV